MNRQSDTVECLRGIIVADCIYRRNRNNHSMNRQSDTVECLRGIIMADCIYRRNRNNHSMNRQSDTVEFKIPIEVFYQQ
jgi:hypothetical protein